MNNGSGLKLVLVFVSIITILSVVFLAAVIKEFYLIDRSEEPAPIKEVAESEPEEQEESENKESDIKPEEKQEEKQEEPTSTTKSEESEEPSPASEQSGEPAPTPEESSELEPEIELVEEQKANHSFVWESHVANGDGSIIDVDAATFEESMVEARSLLDNPTYRAMFPTFVPSYWIPEAIDVIDKTTGTRNYVYRYKNTDLVFMLIKDMGTGEIRPFDACNWYGSSFANIYFENGVPSNSQQIYDALYEQDVLSDMYVSDYAEGDSTINLFDATTEEVLYTDLPL